MFNIRGSSRYRGFTPYHIMEKGRSLCGKFTDPHSESIPDEKYAEWEVLLCKKCRKIYEARKKVSCENQAV